jgi:hypothetical protein|tara:strand:- start:16 stop:1476 length:1461 start_codon:yes stop_codon:yes gene_type:complete
VTARYFISDREGSYVEWDSRVESLSLAGRAAVISGNVGQDWVYVGAGTSLDLSGLGGGVDRIYLTGNFSEYKQSVVGNAYTLSRQVGGHIETVVLSVQSLADELFFADGAVTLDVDKFLDTSSFVFRDIAVDDLDSSKGTPFALGDIVDEHSGHSPVVVYITDTSGGHIPTTMSSHSLLEVVGNVGDDSIFVNEGSLVDATGLSFGRDTIYLTGSLDSYSQSISGNTLTLARTKNGKLESLKLSVQSHSDRVVFADGFVEINSNLLFDATSFEYRHLTTDDLDQSFVSPVINVNYYNVTLDISTDRAHLGGGDSAKITFSFSEVPINFTERDIVVTGGNLSGFGQSEIDTRIYTGIFTPAENSEGIASISVPGDMYSGNEGAGARSISLFVDTLAASVVITSDVDVLTAGESATITFTFSEAPVGFDLHDVVVSGGELSAPVVSKSDPKIYTATFTPTAGSGRLPALLSVLAATMIVRAMPELLQP